MIIIHAYSFLKNTVGKPAILTAGGEHVLENATTLAHAC
jgi:hypothetical protein